MRTIRVTAEHIERGKGGCYTCPIALALYDETAHVWGVNVVACFYKEGSLVLGLPESACKFVADFDARREVQPFEFELPLEERNHAKAITV